MASTYNGSVANLVDPLTSSPLNSPSHAGQHTEINDALQTLGVWTSYTPTLTNLTLGNGTSTWRYTQFNKTVIVSGRISWGSTTSLAGDLTASFPVSAASATVVTGSVLMRDSGTRLFVGSVYQTSATTFVVAHSENGNFGTVNATNPFTWTTNDDVMIQIVYEAA